MAAFALKGAASQGIGPVLSHCTNCGRTEDLLYFNIEGGGAVCRDCSHEFGETYRMLPDQLTEMQKLLKADVKSLRQLKLTDEMAKRIFELLTHHLGYRLNRRMNAFRFYGSL